MNHCNFSACIGEAHIGEVDFSIINLPSLSAFYLSISSIIDHSILENLNQLQNIKELSLDGHLSYFNLDSLVSLRTLKLYGSINESFNFELLKKIRDFRDWNKKH